MGLSKHLKGNFGSCVTKSRKIRFNRDIFLTYFSKFVQYFSLRF